MGMVDDKKQAAIDQAVETIGDQFPLLWRRLYVGLVKEGFEVDQAMDLVKTYIATACRIASES